MSNSLEKYLEDLENKTKNSNIEEFYLWPNTPDIPTHQPKIYQRVGAYDYDSNNPISRSYKVIKELKNLIRKKRLNNSFTIIDITCGDAIVLSEIKKKFPNSKAYGVDCFKNRFVTHPMCYDLGIKIYCGYIQHLFNPTVSTPPKESINVAIMFNSYRGWENAQLSDKDKDLPRLADKFFLNNVKFTFLTATYSKIKEFKSVKGLNIKILGKGEDDSIMFVISKEKITNIFDKLANFIYLLKLRPKKQYKFKVFGIKTSIKL